MRRAPLWQEASSAQHHHFVEEAIRAADATALGGPGFRKGKILFYWSQMRPCVMSAVRRQRHSNKTEVRPLGHECQASCLGGTHFTNCANLRHARLPTATKLFSDARRGASFTPTAGCRTMVADEMCHSFRRVGRPDRLRPRVGRRLDQSLSVPEPRALGGEESARPHQHEPQAEGVAAAVLQRCRGRRRRARTAAAHRRGGLGAAARLLGANSRCCPARPRPWRRGSRVRRPLPTRSSTTGGRGGGLRWGGSAASTSISSLAGCAACSSSTLAAPPARASLIGSRGRSASASTRTHRSMGTGGPTLGSPATSTLPTAARRAA